MLAVVRARLLSPERVLVRLTVGREELAWFCAGTREATERTDSAGDPARSFLSHGLTHARRCDIFETYFFARAPFLDLEVVSLTLSFLGDLGLSKSSSLNPLFRLAGLGSGAVIRREPKPPRLLRPDSRAVAGINDLADTWGYVVF